MTTVGAAEGAGDVNKKVDDVSEQRLGANDTDPETYYDYIQTKAYGAIGWYARSRRRKKFYASLIRFFAIILVSAAGLVPVLSAVGLIDPPGPVTIPEKLTSGKVEELLAAGRDFDLTQLGYVFAALAAALIGMDRFFGLSSGWIRYISAELEIQGRLSRFQMDWAILTAESGAAEDSRMQRMQLVKDLSLDITEIIRAETASWAAEFKTQLAAVEATIRRAQQLVEPGRIELTIRKGDAVVGSVSGSVDGRDPWTTEEERFIIRDLSPGEHSIRVVGHRADGSELVTTLTVTVPAGGAARETVELG